MNKVILIGNLGSTPEFKTLAGNNSVVSFSLATQAFGKDAPPDWHKVEAWGKTAEFVSKWFDKGSKMALEGRVKYESYEKDGEKKYVTKIVAERVEFAGSKRDGGAEADEELPF